MCSITEAPIWNQMKLVLIAQAILMFNCFDRFLLKVTSVSKKSIILLCIIGLKTLQASAGSLVDMAFYI